MADAARTVHSVVPKSHDLEIHTSVLTVESGEQYLDIREYVISLQTYGRGITVPAAAVPGIQDGIEQALEGGKTDGDQ